MPALHVTFFISTLYYYDVIITMYWEVWNMITTCVFYDNTEESNADIHTCTITDLHVQIKQFAFFCHLLNTQCTPSPEQT